jgi:hypothetical protein
MELEGREPRTKYTVAKIKRILASWHIYALVLVYMYVICHFEIQKSLTNTHRQLLGERRHWFRSARFSTVSFAHALADVMKSDSSPTRFLKASKYPVSQINSLGTIPFAVQAVATLIYACEYLRLKTQLCGCLCLRANRAIRRGA